MEPREFYLLKRRKLNISMIEIAQALGVSQSMISLFETGKRNFTLVNEYMNYIDSKEIK
jgi:transcriptional regulator with XRE-family HTH domain